MAYKCLSLCDFFVVQHFFKLCHIGLVLLEDFLGLNLHVGIIGHLNNPCSVCLREVQTTGQSEMI